MQPIHCAAIGGHEEILCFLIDECEVDPNEISKVRSI